MLMGIVKGSVQSTVKHPCLMSEKMLLVQPVDQFQKPSGNTILALDRVQAGPGDLVLIVDEGTN